MRYAAGVRTLLVVSVGLAVLSAIAVITQAVLLAGILADVIIGGADLPDVADRLVALAVVIAVRAGLAWASEEIAKRSAVSVTAGLRRDLLRKAATLGPRWRSGENSGELSVLATTGVDSLHDYVARYLPQLVLSVLIPLIMLGYLFTADLTSAIIVALTLPLIPLFMALVGWYTDRQTKAKWESLSRLAGHFADVIAGLPTLKVFGRAKAQAASVRRVTEDYRKTSMVTLRVAFLSSMVLELLASLSVALVAVAIGLRLVYGDMTLQVGLAVLILAPEAYLPLRQLGTQFHAAADGVAATAKVLAVLETSVAPPGTRTDLPAVPGLRLESVTVGTPGERGAVGPLTVRLPAGRITVIVGPSGIGKTTLLHLLAGMLGPDTGRVLVEGPTGNRAGSGPDGGALVPDIALADIDPGAWRSRLSWAGQGAALQAGSVRDNLALGNDGVDDAALRAALAWADADAFVDSMDQGWNSALGEGGSGISQGQRQRLSLARALARPSSVLLLDEPTASLDAETERRVLDGIARGAVGRTVVLVTHRSAPLAIADQVIELDSDRPTTLPQGDPEALTAVGPW
jgi:ATP-binding cassette, subfamily C, bacterial CydD